MTPTSQQLYMIDVIRSKNRIPIIPQQNRIQEIKKLLENGVDPNFELSPLFSAVIYNDLEMAILLLQYGANPNISSTDKNGRETILVKICKSNTVNSVKFLELFLQYGVDPNIGREKFSGKQLILKWSPLDYLCSNNLYIDKVKLLLKYGANCDINHLIMAVKNDNSSTVQLLLEYGVDPYEKNEKGFDAFECTKSIQMRQTLQNNKYQKNWLSKMRDISENGILIAIKYHPDNFAVWREQLEPTSSLLKYW